jgi:hypothetical protein
MSPFSVRLETCGVVGITCDSMRRLIRGARFRRCLNEKFDVGVILGTELSAKRLAFIHDCPLGLRKCTKMRGHRRGRADRIPIIGGVGHRPKVDDTRMGFWLAI